MQKVISIFFISFIVFFVVTNGYGQTLKDSIVKSTVDTAKFPRSIQKKMVTIAPKDSANILSDNRNVTHTSKKFSPRLATVRSAIVPGWGQAYNHKYWKIPLVYAALGTTTGIFFYNLKTYKQFRTAYRQSVIDGGVADDPLIAPDLRIYSQASLLANRNVFRQNIDYAVLFFVLFWGLNVVDATVDAHLKTFDVSDDLSIQFKPGHSDMANTDGISLVLKIR